MQENNEISVAIYRLLAAGDTDAVHRVLIEAVGMYMTDKENTKHRHEQRVENILNLFSETLGFVVGGVKAELTLGYELTDGMTYEQAFEELDAMIADSIAAHSLDAMNGVISTFEKEEH